MLSCTVLIISGIGGAPTAPLTGNLLGHPVVKVLVGLAEHDVFVGLIDDGLLQVAGCAILLIQLETVVKCDLGLSGVRSEVQL